MTMRDVGVDLYNSMRPLFSYFFTALLIILLFKISHHALIELFREIVKELKTFAELKPTARAINFSGVIGSLFLVAFLVWKNPFGMVIPVEYRIEESNYYSDGITCFLLVYFASFTLICTAISKNSKN
jgi:hypothetical protein